MAFRERCSAALTAPDDGASATRMPSAAPPMIAWKHPGAAFFLIEWQFGMPGGKNWEGSGLESSRRRRRAHKARRRRSRCGRNLASGDNRIDGGFGRSAIAEMLRAAAGGPSSYELISVALPARVIAGRGATVPVTAERLKVAITASRIYLPSARVCGVPEAVFGRPSSFLSFRASPG